MPLVDYPKLFLKADNFRNNGQTSQAVKFYVEIATLANKPDELEHKARALQLAGVAAKDAASNAESSYYRDAVNFFSQAEVAFGELGRRGDVGSVYRDRATAAEKVGLTNEALDWFQKAVIIFQELDDQPGLGITYDKLGLHYYRQGDVTTAQKYMYEALRLLRRHPEIGFFTATALYDLARVKFGQGEFEAAQDLAEESVSWFEADHGERSYGRRLAQLYGFLALCYYETTESKKAKAVAQKYKKLLQTFDPQTAKQVEEELKELAK